MAADNLREELMALPGVADAEVEADGEATSGVRVRLHPDADAVRVGAEVQRVLASHGMRSRVAGDDLAPVVSLPLAPAEIPPRPEAPPPLPEAVAEVATSGAPEPVADPGEELPAAEGSPAESDVVSSDGLEGSRPSLASLAYEESIEGVIVTAVASDGQRFSRRAADTTDAAVSAAVAAAVGALAEGRPQRLLWVGSETVDGSVVVTVVLEKTDGTRVAGAAIVRAAKAYAVARATFVALRG